MHNAKMLAGVYLGVLAVGVLAGNLTRSGEPVRLPDVEPIASLEAFGACDDALAYFTEAAAEQAAERERQGGARVTAEALASEGAVAESAPQAAPAPAAAADTGAAPDAFSATNVQEAGVDEPDLVKTDGRRIVTITAEGLQVIDARAAPPVLAGSLVLPGEGGQELLLAGDRALVFSTTWSDQPVAESSRPAPGGTAQSVLTLVDLTETATPRVASTLTLDGEYVAARMVDGVARVVLRSAPAGPVHDMQVPGPPPGAAPRAGAVGDRGPETIDAWVPSYRLEADRVTIADRLVGCDQIYRPAEFAGLGTVSVLSVDLAGDLTPSGTSTVVADAQTVYASADTLYVAFTDWAAQESTQIHAFDITDPAAAVYRASGAVPGRLLNQWALSEHAGHLRVATTEGVAGAEPSMPVEPVGPAPGEPLGPADSQEPLPPPAPAHSAVTVLAPSGEELAQVGRVDGLGPDERIYAVRFMGDVGYVVTFRETDPLYTLDLSDPSAPQVLGELKILGYSAYLHPLGDGLLLGIGQDATEEGQVLGTQLSLFDVGDLRNPVRVQHATIAGGHSPVEYDHRAFLHWPATGTIVLPLEIFTADPAGAFVEGDLFAGVAAFTVDRDAGFTERGRVSHTPHASDAWEGAIRRSLVVGDTLYTFSEAGMGAADLATLDERGWIPFR